MSDPNVSNSRVDTSHPKWPRYSELYQRFRHELCGKPEIRPLTADEEIERELLYRIISGQTCGARRQDWREVAELLNNMARAAANDVRAKRGQQQARE
jgi:hypothetical protein